MSWEVWTMPQKTSFCNRTLLRSDLRHFWPAGFVYVLIWLMILPIQLLRVGYDAPRGDGLLAENLEPLLHNVIVGASVGSLVLAVVCGGLSVRFRRVGELLAPLVAAVKAVPVVSFIILTLIFFDARNLSVFIAGLMVFPPVYLNVRAGIAGADRQLLEMARVCRVPWL